jgi:hypothetical protein
MSFKTDIISDLFGINPSFAALQRTFVGLKKPYFLSAMSLLVFRQTFFCIS